MEGLREANAGPPRPREAWTEHQTAPGALATSGAHLAPATAVGAVPASDKAAVQSTSKEGKSYFGRIRVLVRCRPLQPGIETDHTNERIHVDGDEVLVCDKAKLHEGRSYRFDRVLPPEADQVTVFAEVAPLVEHVLDGFHATVFAYGQTGSGKTFTMDGLRYTPSSQQQRKAMLVPDVEGTAVQQHGIMPRVIQLLFDRARERQRASGVESGDLFDLDSTSGNNDGGVEYTFRCSYYQIYNEKIADLLRATGPGAPATDSGAAAMGTGAAKLRCDARNRKGVDASDLRVRWHKGDVFKVENLFVCSCGTPDEMRAMLFSGIQHKVVSSHLMNQQSSRSHCVFTIYVERRARRNGELLSKAELSLVDLAGSEKIGLLSHNPTAKLVKESIDINTSLLALGKVITALSDGAGKAATAAQKSKKIFDFGGRHVGGAGAASSGAGHIPYRDSKLTMLLKHALGGNSLTTMIACISPSDRYVDETTSTLLYAGRAKNIRNAPHVNEDATTALIRQLREEIAQLKAELGYYREMAAKSLVDREAHATLCGRCGGATNGAASPEASLTSPPLPLPAAAKKGGAQFSAAAKVASGEVDQLADSLVAACEMLRKLMQVNAQLRESYDAVRDVQEAAERREAELNSENLALRERLSVLETIVLQEEENAHEEEEEGEAAEETQRPQPGSKSAARHRSPSLKHALHAAKVSAAAAAASLRSGKQTSRSDVVGRSPAGHTQSTSSATPTVSGAGGDTTRSAAGTSLSRQHSSTGELYTASTQSSFQQQQQPLSSSPSSHTLAQTPPVRMVAVGESTVVEKMPAVLRGAQTGLSPAFKRGGADDPDQRHGHRKKKSLKHKKKPTALARRLREYEERYRVPHQTETYADYYQQPSRSRPAAASTAPPSTVLVVPGAPPMRASEPAAPYVTAALQEMRSTVAKLPKVVVPEFVPVSLLKPGMFGALAFGGTDADKAAFEQNRSTREARLRALQQRQQDLYRQVHQAVQGRRDGGPESATCDDAAPTYPPAAVASIYAPQSQSVRGSSRGEGAGAGGARDPLGGSGVAAHSPYASSTAASLASAAGNRSTTASFREPATRPRPAASPSDSMARLMEYLERNR